MRGSAMKWPQSRADEISSANVPPSQYSYGMETAAMKTRILETWNQLCLHSGADQTFDTYLNNAKILRFQKEEIVTFDNVRVWESGEYRGFPQQSLPPSSLATLVNSHLFHSLKEHQFYSDVRGITAVTGWKYSSVLISFYKFDIWNTNHSIDAFVP